MLHYRIKIGRWMASLCLLLTVCSAMAKNTQDNYKALHQLSSEALMEKGRNSFSQQGAAEALACFTIVSERKAENREEAEMRVRALNNCACVCRLGSKKIFGRIGQMLVKLCVNNCNDISCFIPSVKRFFVQGIEKFVNIKNARRFNDHPVIAEHPHRDQLGFKASFMTISVARTGYRFNIALFALKLLQ